jgi:hypothetical protein
MGALIGGGESHKSNITPMGEAFDPTSWITKGIGADFLNPHKYINPATDKLNEWGSKITGPINRLNTQIEPGAAMLNQTEIGKQWNETIENRPVDAAAMAMAAIFGGGALMGGGAASGAAPMGMAGSTGAGMSVITPTFASGIGATSAAAPVFGSMGAFGGSTAAGLSALTPSFASAGGATGGSFLGNLSTSDKVQFAQKLADILKQDSQQSSRYSAPIDSYHNYHLPRMY